jgi:hypothetical protein
MGGTPKSSLYDVQLLHMIFWPHPNDICDDIDSWQPFFMCMTMWSFFGTQGSTYLPWIAWLLQWWIVLHYLNLITKPTPLQMCLNRLGQWVYPNQWGSWMHANYRGSQVHPNCRGSWVYPSRQGSQTWPGLGRSCAWALPLWLALCACGSWDLKRLLSWWPLFYGFLLSHLFNGYN